jgi:hypothetical protein
VDVGVHRPAPADRVAREQKEPAEAADLVELLRPVGAAHLDPVFLGQKRHEVAAIAFAVALDAADLVEKARQDAGIGVPHAGEGIGFVRRDVRLDQRLAAVEGPFVHAVLGVVDVAVEERAVVGVVHDLADGRAGAFRHHAVDHAFARRHPGSGKAHCRRLDLSRFLSARIVHGVFCIKKQRSRVSSISIR